MERKKHVGRNLPAEADEQNADPSCLIFPFKKSCLIENLKIAGTRISMKYLWAKHYVRKEINNITNPSIKSGCTLSQA